MSRVHRSRPAVRFAASVSAACLCLGAAAQSNPERTRPLQPDDEIIALETRPGITTQLLIASPKGEAKGIFLLFPGGPGRVFPREDRVSRGFLVRAAPSYAENGFHAVVVSPPADRPAGFNLTDDRVRDWHMGDIRAVLDHVAGRWTGPVFLAGHSMGSLSVTKAALTGDARIRGVVLLSSLSGRGRKDGSLHDLPLRKLAIPVLVVNHRDDACATTLFHDAAWLVREFGASPARLAARGEGRAAACRGSLQRHLPPSRFQWGRTGCRGRDRALGCGRGDSGADRGGLFARSPLKSFVTRARRSPLGGGLMMTRCPPPIRTPFLYPERSAAAGRGRW
jgi:pimeloyl-ACP methyl ester carboxylesterase